MESVSFTRMEDGTRAEYQFLEGLWNGHHQGRLADNVLAMLKTLAGPKLGYQIDRYQHSLQSATRALRGGADEETVVCALLHDIGDTLAPDNHSDFAAAILKPYVSEANHWIVKHHGVFQGYYYQHHLGGDRNARERYRDHPQFEACAEFCARYDQNCFDPDYDTLPLEHFEPMVRRIFARTPRGYE
jgi:predicted HD phosphohydrolase